MPTIHCTAEIEISAPAREAWAILSDYARDVEWRDGVVSMTPDRPGEAEVGTVTDEHLRFAGRTWHNLGVVTSLQPGRRLAWRTTAGARAHGARSVTALDDRCCRVLLELTAVPTGMMVVFAPVLRRMLRRGLRADILRLRDLVESRRVLTPAAS
jgi:hypothetical protein